MEECGKGVFKAVNPLTEAAFASFAPGAEPTSAPTQAAAPLVHEFEIDGIPCFWAPGHGEMTVGLVFGVGEADEQPHERGLTSLIAELAIRRLGGGSNVNWSVNATHAVLQASGASIDMQPFLRSLVRALGSLSIDHLDEVSESLVAQSLKCDDPAMNEALSAIYGFRGPGVSTLPAFGLLDANPQSVAGWVRSFFIRENVAAFFYGPRPEGQSFANFASGQRPERLLIKPLANRPPTMHRSMCGGPSLFTPIESGRKSTMVVEVARNRLARRLAELTDGDCAVTATLSELDAKTSWLALRTTVDHAHHQRVFEVMRSELYRLAAEGPGGVEVDEYVEHMDELHSGRHSETALAEVQLQAQSFVRGAAYEGYPEFRTTLESVSSTGLGLPLLRAMPAAMWVVPDGSPAQDPNMELQSTWCRRFPSKRTADPFPDQLEYVDGHLQLTYRGRDEAVVISREQVVGVTGLPDGTLELHTNAGLVLPLDPEAPGAGEPIVSFLAKLPTELLIRVPYKLELVVIPMKTSVAPAVPAAQPVQESEVASTPVAVAVEPVEAPEQVEAVETPLSPAEQLAAPAAAPESDVGVPDAEPESVEQADEIAEARRKRKFLAKKGEKSASGDGEGTPAVPGELGVPDDTVTYCYPSAIQFAEALVAGAWPLAERLFAQSAESPDNQAHLLRVAAHTGGDPSRFDQWVDGSPSPGVPQMIRGANRLRRAWNEHLQSGPKKSSKQQKRLLEEFEAAEVDLVLSSIELDESPVPYIPLLEVTRILARPRQVAEQRYVAHVERGALLAGHLQWQRFVSKAYTGSHRDMWEHVDYVCRGAEAGSPSLAIAPMAFIEQWLDECAMGTDAANASWMMKQEGLEPILQDAARRSYGSQSFDLLSTGSAKALEIFFTFHWSVGDFVSAAALTKRMGKRYSGDPMGFFSKDSWSTIRATAESLAQQAA